MFIGLAGGLSSNPGNIELGLLPTTGPTFARVRAVPLVSISIAPSVLAVHKARAVPSVSMSFSLAPATAATLSIKAGTVAILNATQTVYFVGDQAQVSVVFQNSNQVLVDPTNISLLVKDPSGVITTYNYPGAAVSKTGTGQYTGIFSLTLPGTYQFRWVGTGNNPSVAESSIPVQTPAF